MANGVLVSNCLAVGEKFWPWTVLEQSWMHLPQHPNCPCRLLSLQEATRQGLMTADHLPDDKDALARAKALMGEADRLEEQWAPEALAEVVRELESDRLVEAAGRKLLRWSHGSVKGGEFRPVRGGDRGKLSKAELARLMPHSPAGSAAAGLGREVTIKGQPTFIPEATHFDQRIGGTRFTSPAGGTNIYREGLLVGDDHPDLASASPASAWAKPPLPGAEPPVGHPDWSLPGLGSGHSTGYRPPKDPLLGQSLVPAGEPQTGGPIPDYTGTELTFAKQAGGSTGARFATTPHGDKHLVKVYQGNPDRVATELLANAVYRELGAPVADAGTLRYTDPQHGETLALTYPLLDGQTQRIGRPSRALGDHFMADALVGNWDFIGLQDDNVLWDQHDNPIRIDQGGTFQFRAQGQSKPYGPIPTEVWSMISPKGQGFGKVIVTDQMKRDQAQQIGDRLTNDRIDALVSAAPFRDERMREEIRQALKDRTQWMRDFAAGEQAIPQPLDGPLARSELTNAQASLTATPEEHAAVAAAVAGGLKDANGFLRHAKPKDKPTAEVGDMLKGLDSLLRDTRVRDDVYGYVPFDPADVGADPAQADQLVGRTMRSPGYASASTRRGAVGDSPGLIRLTIPAGTRALYTYGLEGAEDFPPGGPDLILGRGTRMRIVDSSHDGQRLVLDAVALP